MPTPRFKVERLSVWIPAVLFFLAAQLALPGNSSASPSESANSSPNLNTTIETTGHPAITQRSLTGRHRLEFRAGYWDWGRRQRLSPYAYIQEKTHVHDLVGAFSYAYWAYDQIAADITFRGLVAEITSIDGASGESESAVIVTSAMFGIRFYPVSSALSPLRPFITASVGPYLGIESHQETDNHANHTVKTAKTLGSFGGYLGGGLDIQIGRRLMVGVHAGYNVMADFPETLGIENNYSGVELSAGISLLLG